MVFTPGFKVDQPVNLDNYKALTKGDSLPAMASFPVLNYKSTTINLADFKDRLLVLDFWATTCGSCLEAMPSIAKLQEQFKGHVQVVDVDYEHADYVAAYFSKHPAKKALGLPVITGDILLKKEFPYQYLPHVVWIRNGVFIGATDGDYLNAINIEKVLANANFTFTTKDQVNVPDYHVPLFLVSGNNGATGSIMASSVFTSAMPGLQLKAGWDTSGQKTRFYAVNHPLLNLFAVALNSGLPFIPNRRLLAIHDSSLILNLKHDYEDQWAASHTYCSQIIVPGNNSKAQIKELLLAEIRSSVGLIGVIAKYEMNCLTLSTPVNSSTASLPHHSLYKLKEISIEPGKPVILHHIDLDDLAWLMNEQAIPPVIVEIDDKPLVFDLDMSALPNSVDVWKNLLATKGIMLNTCKRQLDMFVLTDADKHLP